MLGLFYFAFFIIFSLALIIANIYCFKTKKYLYLFIPCMLFLPEYYGISINDSLPLITVSRIMFLIFFVYSFINRRRDINFSNIYIKQLPTHYYLLGGYFFFRILSNLFHVSNDTASIKTIFLIVFEQLVLLIAIYWLSPTKEEILTLIKTIVMTATVFYVIGIIESMAFIRPFDALYTVNRHVMNEHYIRLGLLRSTTTLGLPGMYGNMCILTLALTLYLYTLNQSKRYIFSMALCILAIIHSGSRSNYLYLIVIISTYFLFIIFDKNKRKHFIKHMVLVVLSLTLFIGSACYSNEYYNYFYTGSAKSILNEFGCDFDLNANAPAGVDGYGGNGYTNKYTGGFNSRKVQFTGIIYTFGKNPLIGLGSDCLSKKEAKYRFGKQWIPCTAIDVGLVEIIMYEGILGLLGYICILSIFPLYILKEKIWSHLPDKILLLLPLSYLLTTLSTVNMTSFLFTILIIYMYIYPNNSKETN